MRAIRGRGAAILFALTALSLTITRPAIPAGAQQASVPLSPGWNNVLYTGPPGPIGTALAALSGNLSAVLLWDSPGQRWHQYFPSAPQGTDLQSMLPGQVYWIAVQSAASLPAGVATPSPAQIVPGWNNVAYIGSGSPGAATLEQSPVWAWDAPSQRWLLRDPSRPTASDFQTLTALRAYWVNLPGASASSTSSLPAATPARGSSCYQFTSTQPVLADVDEAVTRAGNAGLHVDPALELPAERMGPDGSGSQQPAFVPPSILRGIAWVETSWHQATWETQRGQSGPTLISSGCAYGLMQIATGMSISSTPSAAQQLIGGDFRANAAAGAQVLAKNWNRDQSALPYVGRHDPHVLEDWYFAIWAYHCFGDSCASYGAHDDPDDPSLPWPRPIYNSPQQLASGTSLTYADYPYEELIYGLVNNPPTVDGRPGWQAIAAQLPPHGTVGFPQPHSVAEASAHLDNGTSLAVYTPASAPASPAAAGLVPTGAPQVIAPSGIAPIGGR